jgi:hypothetical protein
MRHRIYVASILAACGVALLLPTASFADGFVETSGSYAEGNPIRGDRYDTLGNKKVSLGTLTSCEDQLNNVCRVEQQFFAAGNLTADTLVKNGAGFVHSLVCNGTDGTATAGTIILYNNTAESGTIIYQLDVQAVAYNYPVVVPLNVIMTTGIYLGFNGPADMRCMVVYR